MEKEAYFTYGEEIAPRTWKAYDLKTNEFIVEGELEYCKKVLFEKGYTGYTIK